MTATRRAWTALTDPQLLAQCAVDTYRASGPGGQKRNKTSSAVRIRHPPSGLIVIAEESRSQHENRARALRRLRQALYLKVRDELSPEGLTPAGLAARCLPPGCSVSYSNSSNITVLCSLPSIETLTMAAFRALSW